MGLFPATQKFIVKNLPIDDLCLEPELQMREMQEEAIEDYAEHLKDLPPILIVRDADFAKDFVVDGWHTLAAARRKGWTSIPCKIIEGDYADAVLAAAKANATHGIRRTDDDKERAIKRLLAQEKWQGKSSRWIATELKVSPQTVEKVRNSNTRTNSTAHGEQLKKPKKQGESREGRDGKTRKLFDKEEDTPPAPAAIVDALDRVVPPMLVDLFDDNWLKNILEEVDSAIRTFSSPLWRSQLRNKTKRYAGWLDPGLALTRLENVRECMVTFRETIEAGIPYVVCPHCAGKKCGKCRNAGFIPVAAFEEDIGSSE